MVSVKTLCFLLLYLKVLVNPDFLIYKFYFYLYTKIILLQTISNRVQSFRQTVSKNKVI